ncbi:MAG: hypothetical protein C5B52_02440 [Bacteroidetes bacterium]|nr:MAG: hypothetical protein C5B52_02440 [Bacteroidota bacterium]
MMKKMLIFFISVIPVATIGQSKSDSWKISLDSKVIVNLASEKKSDSAIIYLNKLQLSQANSLIIEFTEAQQSKDWNRIFTLYNGQKELIHFDFPQSSGIYELPVQKLAPRVHDERNLFLYTYSLPNDKNLAATVRVRRILICRIIYKD